MKTNYTFSYTASFCVENARELGIPAALLLDKIVKLCKCTTRQDGFCWYTAKQFEDDTSLKEDSFYAAAKKLEDEGIVERKVTYVVGTMNRATHFRILKPGQTRNQETGSNPASVNTTNTTTNMPSADASGTSSNEENVLSSVPFDEKVIDVGVKQKERQTANAKAAMILRKFGDEVGLPTGGNRNKEVHRVKQLLDAGYSEEDIIWVAKWSKSDDFYKDSALLSRLSADAFDRAKLAKDKNSGGKIVRGFHL